MNFLKSIDRKVYDCYHTVKKCMISIVHLKGGDRRLHDMEPVYVQIVRHLKRAIFLGEAAVGESLPSRRELAAQLCINPNTAQKAFRLMEEEGLIQTPKNAASTVFYDEETLGRIRQEMTGDLVRQFVAEAKENRLTLAEVMKMVEEAWQERGEDV